MAMHKGWSARKQLESAAGSIEFSSWCRGGEQQASSALQCPSELLQDLATSRGAKAFEPWLR